ncbi:hypothetical protein N7471_010450 [Penicillium samsonianum]|uniref:uncharacterized protein n=1 Tax=Penicillium samsonianum TaxID=1882272 RepID=UPI00254949F5|nr:uncharacterized protein N7471_010450 [Penicillium samsonianum]KAJ6125957.1 hypothetical protein N7471_010450 [Penicillium samsonianum]
MNMEVTLPDQDEDDEGWVSNLAFDFRTDPTLRFVQIETTDLSMNLEAEGGAAFPTDTTSEAVQQANNNFDLMNTAFLDHLLPTENYTEDWSL